jgi:hypothetical protein
MAKRDNTFLLIAAGLGIAAWVLFKPKAAGPATHQNGMVGGGVAGSPNQVITLAPGVTVPFDPTAVWRL